MKPDDERKELIEQLANDTNKFLRSVRNVTDVHGFIKCDIELLKKFHNSYEECCNILDEIYVNVSESEETTADTYYKTYGKVPLNHIYNMSSRLYNILTRCGFTYLGEMSLVRDSDIKCLKNLGKVAFKELCELMDLYGISFGHENVLRDHILSFKPGDKVIYDGKTAVILSINEPHSTKSSLWPNVVIGYEDIPSYGIELRKACNILNIHRL